MKDFITLRKPSVLHRVFNWLAANFIEYSKPFRFNSGINFRPSLGNSLRRLWFLVSKTRPPKGQSQKPSLNESRATVHARLLQLSFYLREPLKETQELLNRNEKHLQKVEILRNHPQRHSTLVEHIKKIHVPQESHFKHLDAADETPKIIVSFHFGDFIYGVHKLLSSQESTANTLVLSQKKSTEQYLKNMKSAFGENSASLENQLLLDEVTIKDLMVFLRRPKSRLVMFADLPSAYGETTEINFLGRKAFFPRSIGLLALASKVPILPVICINANTGHRVEIGKQIEPNAVFNETKADAITRITQTQIDFFEYYFLQDKSQWRYLQYLAQYFVKGS
ncbi:MAG: hypothetical protein AB8B95_04645 [Pseudohongiellaceae bacterium]